MPRFPSLCALAALLFCHSAVQAQTPNAASKRAIQAFRFAGAKASRARVLPPRNANLSAQSSRVAAADGSLLFEYKGFTTEHQQILSGFVSRNYSSMVNRYGAPSPEQRANGGKTIEIIGNVPEFSPAYQPLRAPNNSNRGDGGSIYFSYDIRKSPEANQFLFTRLILRAFQGPNNFSYNFEAGSYNDIYQAGLADAVALLVLYDSLSESAKRTFNPSNYGFTYLLHIYDLVNRPELSNAFILPPINDLDNDSRLPDFRLGMAQAAWLKVAIDHPTFFRDFNAKYYADVPARQAASQSQLRAIAAAVAPRVENLVFSDWVRRQYALDNSITVGTKILPLVVPIETPANGVQDPGFVGFAEAFTTDSSGKDTRILGSGRVEAIDENGQSIGAKWLNPINLNFATASSPSEVLMLRKVRADDGEAPDFGAIFSNMSAPNRARLGLKFSFKGTQANIALPFVGSNGGAASQTTIYGLSQNGISGDAALSNAAGNEVVGVSRGAFAGTKNYPSGPSVVTQVTLGGRTFQRNTAWLPVGGRGVEFVLDGATRNDNFTLKTASGASTVRMISLPIFPSKSDESEILSIAAGELKLARYRPNLSPATVAGNNLTFGIDADRHEIYPNISAPMAPGRGYWLGSGEITRVVTGSEPRTDRAYEVPLAGGWNQFGVPFNRNYPVSAIQVRYGSFAPVSLADAVRNGLVTAGIWRWQGRGSYARADIETGATLPPFEGFYVHVIPTRGVSLVFVPGATALTAARVQSGWNVPLLAATNSARDSNNRFGVSNDVASREAAAKPPTGPPTVTLRFASSGSTAMDANGAGAASGWADSFLPALAREGKWDLSVDGIRQGETVALAWGDLKSVPDDVKLTLRDHKSGKSLALRAGGTYKWTGDSATRQLSILAARQARASLNVSVAPSQRVAIDVSLNFSAPGRLEIQNLAGDTIFVVKTGDFAVRNDFVWNGRRADGKNAAPGRYRAVWIPALQSDRGAAREFDWRP